MTQRENALANSQAELNERIRDAKDLLNRAVEKQSFTSPEANVRWLENQIDQALRILR